MSFAKAVDLLQLARLANGRTGVSLAEIEDAFGCVRRTAQRMTQALESVFPDAEAYVDYEGHKRWRIPHGKVSEFFAPTADQLAALELAKETLTSAGLGSEAHLLSELGSSVKLLTSDRRRAGLEADEEALLEAMGHAARPGPRPASDAAVDQAIAAALKGPFRLTIRYRGRNDETARDRKIEPYGILLGTRRYLIARDPARDDNHLRHFRIEDIEQATTTEEWFARDPDFNLADYASRSFGVFQADAEYKPVHWRFSARAAPHAARYRFHPDQEMTTNPDGSLDVRFTASGHLEMCWHLYAWGDQVEVIEPAELARLVNPHRRDDFPGLP